MIATWMLCFSSGRRPISGVFVYVWVFGDGTACFITCIGSRYVNPTAAILVYHFLL